MNGLQLYQSGGAVLDSVWVVDNDLTSATTTAYGTSGKVTHIFLRDPLGQAAESPRRGGSDRKVIHLR
jgi:hypothetical protein